MQRSEGFPAVARSDARVLVLGSLPGQRSLREAQYYAHPQNAFWRIMNELLSVDGDYRQRCALLKKNRIALWDVLEASVRPGSLDADIRIETASANDFQTFIEGHRSLRKIVFNGRKAEQLFRRLVPEEFYSHLELEGLPSTSPAYAAMAYRVKLAAWEKGLQFGSKTICGRDS